MGIEPEFLPHVFRRFAQEDGTTVRKHGGLGLGLAIVRDLVEAHGGTVHGESEGKGKGSTFSVFLPIRDAASDAPEDASTSSAKPSVEARGQEGQLARCAAWHASPGGRGRSGKP